jgi:hypothetical protein
MPYTLYPTPPLVVGGILVVVERVVYGAPTVGAVPEEVAL